MNKVEAEAMKKKKKDLLGNFNALNKEGKLDEETIAKIAEEWIELADRDGNGELDFKEFHDFFSKIDGLYLSDDELKQMFNEIDVSGNGMISGEEFALLIHRELVADNEVEDMENQ